MPPCQAFTHAGFRVVSERLSALVGTEPKTLYPPTEREDMHKVAKIAITGLFAAGLVGAGVGTAAAGTGGTSGTPMWCTPASRSSRPSV